MNGNYPCVTEHAYKSKLGDQLKFIPKVPTDTLAADSALKGQELQKYSTESDPREMRLPESLVDLPEHLDVRRILLSVVPGDGSGHEVYAKSVKDVEETLSRLDERIEELELKVSQSASSPFGPEELQDCKTHRLAWRSALEAALCSTTDAANASFWAHEIAAFDRTFSGLAVDATQATSGQLVDGPNQEARSYSTRTQNKEQT